MLFNSLLFWLFFAVVFAGYWLLRHKSQNAWLLLASYIFYGAWDWRFLSLLFLSTLVDYLCAQRVDAAKNPKHRKAWLVLSLGFNLGLLGFFKYFNFFAGSLKGFLGFWGFEADFVTLHIILPVGISFYTFQTMSYVIDVYRKELKPARNFVDFALFVSFFPQLVAGPIERAGTLLPQVQSSRVFKIQSFYDGGWLILWGLFKKIVIADNAALLADAAFSSSGLPGWFSLCGVYAFALQIYGDFSGYSDIARGLAKWLGFELMVNFRSPYIAESPVDFWRRWHISLSTWLRDYVYIPLGGNRGNALQTYSNLLLTMAIGGLWHGASWTFIVWGVYHGILLVANKFWAGKTFLSRPQPFIRIFRILATFHLVCLGWIFFRAGSLTQALVFLGNIFYRFDAPVFFQSILSGTMAAFLIMILGLVGIYAYNHAGPIGMRWRLSQAPALIRSTVYVLLIYFIIYGGVSHAQQFIYFQF